MGEPKCGLCGSDLISGMYHHCKPAWDEENAKLRVEADRLRDLVIARDKSLTEALNQRDTAELQVAELQKILYRVRWKVSTDNFCDCRQPNGLAHKEDCLLFIVARAVEMSPKCCPPFEPGKDKHSEFCRNHNALKRVVPVRNDTCENYRPDGSTQVYSRYCSGFAADVSAHAPTCQFFQK